MEKNTKKEGKIMEIKFDQAFVYQTIKEIMAIDSPSGFTKNAVAYVEKVAKQFNLPFTWTRKGNGIIFMEGKDPSKTVGVCAHVDTLGLMVRSIKANGHLAITKVGGPIMPTLQEMVAFMTAQFSQLVLLLTFIPMQQVKLVTTKTWKSS